MLPDNASEAGLPWDGPPVVARVDTPTDAGTVSAIVWGGGAPSVVLLHGGAQNAHTWDTVALALREPLVAIDLPGHGHSAWREDGKYGPEANAATLAPVIERLATTPVVLVGMSLGGLTAMAIAGARPDLVGKLVIVDVTPGVDRQKAAPIAEFVSGPESFASFEELLERTMQYNPTRTESSLRRGLIHNTKQRDDGHWVWRYDRFREGGGFDFPPLWEAVSGFAMPVTLVRGSLSGVVSDEDVATFRERAPHTDYRLVDGAGHSVQGDKPVELAAILREVIDA
ncbi:MAG TPA: alpha/beta hydrolase [Mycobacteriales bacterium]|nr:alpha/beta hydrolase [Mycobacteriales bacterium]